MNFRISKTLVLFLTAVVLVIIVIGMLIFSFTTSPEPEPSTLLPTPTPLNPRLFQKRSTTSNSPIKSTAVSPKEDPTGKTIANPSQKVTFILSKPTDSETLSVTVDPDIPLVVKTGSNNTAEIYPEPPYYWRPDVLYTITLKDQGGQVIDTYQIKVPPLAVEDVQDESAAWPSTP